MFTALVAANLVGPECVEDAGSELTVLVIVSVVLAVA